MRYYMFNKPKGYLTACSDARQKTVMDLIPEDEREGLFPVGRLDKDTEGFLILTDDGKFSFKISDPSYRVEKTYVFWAKGKYTDDKLDALRQGVFISTKRGDIEASCKVEKLAEGKVSDIAHLLDENPARLIYTRYGEVPVVRLKMTITEGKKHQVKKMAKSVGLTVVYLERIAICGVFLDKDLPRGKFRPLSSAELETMLKTVIIGDT